VSTSRSPSTRPEAAPELPARLGSGVEPSREWQMARALSQLPELLWAQLDDRGRLSTWNATLAALVDPQATTLLGRTGGLQELSGHLAADGSRERWREALIAVQRGPVELELSLAAGQGRTVPAQFVLRRTPELLGGAGLCLVGTPRGGAGVALALLDPGLQRVLEAWPAAAQILAAVDRAGDGRAVTIAEDVRAQLRERLATATCQRVELAWGTQESHARWLELDLVAVHGDGAGDGLVVARIRDVPDLRRQTLDLRDRERRLRRVVEATASVTGRGFLRSLVKALSRALGVRVAYVAERLPRERDRLRMLCLWSGRDFTSGYDYDAQGTLDGLVLEDGPIGYSEGLPARLAADSWLRAERLESYFGVPIPDSSGDVMGVLGVMNDTRLDLTLPVEEILSVFASRVGVELERLRAEEALRASEDRWRSLLEHAPDLILSLDPEGQVLLHNQAERSGLLALGARLVETVLPADRAALEAALHAVIAVGRATGIEFRADWSVRGPRWYAARLGPLRRGASISGVILVATDVTEAKNREQQRERRSTIEQGITALSTRFLNLPLERVDEEVDQALAELGPLFQADRAFLYRAEGGGSTLVAAHSYCAPGIAALPARIGEGLGLGWLVERIRAGGDAVWMRAADLEPDERGPLEQQGIGRLVCVPLSVRGERLGLFGLTFADPAASQPTVSQPTVSQPTVSHPTVSHPTVSHQDVARQSIVWPGPDLDGELVPLIHITADLLANTLDRKRFEQQRLQLEQELHHAQKLEAIGTLAGGIAHDFNNLLTGILGHASLLSRAGLSDPQVARAAQVIETAATRAASLTSQLLGFARRREAVFSAVSLHAAIEEVVELLRRTLPRDVAVELELRAANPYSWGDSGLLGQVLLNLAVNAGDAMGQGGTLTFRTRNEQVRSDQSALLPELTPGQYLVLEVRDTGMGMTPGVLERIFDPFFTTKDPGRGSGMGLAVVYGIVRKHGGAIRCESAPGQGSTFRMHLPLAHQADQGPPLEGGVGHQSQGELEAQGPARPTCVLVVDDESVVLETASALLQSLGFEVLEACGGQAALEQYRARGAEIDLVLLDLMMPGMGGRECFAELRRLDPQVCVVLSSGWGFEGITEELEALGLAGFARKPYGLSELATIVADALARCGREP
jgi:PAS domain S-box-containing protein